MDLILRDPHPEPTKMLNQKHGGEGIFLFQIPFGGILTTQTSYLLAL